MFEDEERITYFDVIKLIDEVFPSKSEIDYREISPDELVERFNNAVRNSGISLDETKLRRIRIILYSEQNYIYKRKTNKNTVNEQYLIDQNDYMIQGTISNCKNEIIRTIMDKMDRHFINSDGIYRSRIFGDLKTVESIVNEENIRKYIKDVLYVTCAKNDKIDRSLYVPQKIIGDIFRQFGLSTKPYASQNHFREAERILEDLVDDTIKGHGAQHEGNEDTFYTVTYDYYTSDMNEFNENLEKAINDITGIICSIALPAVERTRKEEQEIQKYRKAPIQEESPVSTIIEEDFDEAYDEEKEVPKEKLEDTIKRYEKLQTLISENITYSNQLSEVNKEIEELEKKLDALQRKKSSIKQKIDKNEEKMRLGF